METTECRSHSIATVVLVSGALFLGACDSTPDVVVNLEQTPTTATINVVSPTSSATTAQNHATRTVAPAPVAPAMPAGPVTVTVTLDHAKRKAEDRFVPSNAAQIEGAYYLTAAALCEALRESDESLWLMDRIWGVDACFDDPEYNPANYHVVRAPAFAIVDVSFQGMDLDYPGLVQPEEPRHCQPIPHDIRSRILVWFDATGGEYLGWKTTPGAHSESWFAYRHSPLGSAESDTTIRLAAGDQRGPLPYDATATARIVNNEATKTALTRLGLASPTPTPTLSYPKGSSAPRDLRPGEVPRALLEAAAVAPLTPGAWWRYRVTGVFNGAEWWTGSYTETVISGTRIVEDLAALRIATIVSPEHSLPLVAGPWGSGGESALRYLVSDGVLRPLGDIQPGHDVESSLALDPECGLLYPTTDTNRLT